MSSALKRIAATYGDPYGNDITAVKIPTTGFAAIGPVGGSLPSNADLADPAFTLPEDYAYLGLFTQDGGPAEENEAGDMLAFFQIGYELPSGDDEITETLKLAEDNEAVRRLVYGDDATVDGVVYAKAGAVPVGSFPYLRVTRYKNGTEMRRAGMVHVQSIEPEQETRGEVRAVAVTFAFEVRQVAAGREAYLRDAFIDPDAPTPPPPPEPDPLDVTPGVKTLAPNAWVKLAVALNGEPIPGSALTASVFPSGVVEFATFIGDPYIRAVGSTAGTATVELGFEDEEGWHTGQVAVSVDPTLPPLVPRGSANHELQLDDEYLNSWSSGWLEIEGREIPGDGALFVDPTPADRLAVEVVREQLPGGGYRWEFFVVGLSYGSGSVVASWDDGLDGGIVYATEPLEFTVVPLQFAISPYFPASVLLGVQTGQETAFPDPYFITVTYKLGSTSVGPSSNPDISVVVADTTVAEYYSSQSRVYSRGVGTTTVTATYAPAGAEPQTVHNDITVVTEAVTVDPAALSLAVGQSATIVPKIAGSPFGDGSLTARSQGFSDSDVLTTSVAKVDGHFVVTVTLVEQRTRRNSVTVKHTRPDGIAFSAPGCPVTPL